MEELVAQQKDTSTIDNKALVDNDTQSDRYYKSMCNWSSSLMWYPINLPVNKLQPLLDIDLATNPFRQNDLNLYHTNFDNLRYSLLT